MRSGDSNDEARSQVESADDDAKSTCSTQPDPALKTNSNTAHTKGKSTSRGRKRKPSPADVKIKKEVTDVVSAPRKRKFSNARSEWFDPNLYDTKRIKHEPKSNSDGPPPGCELYCSKCYKPFTDEDTLKKHEKKCYKKYSYPCQHPDCDHVNSQKSLMHQHYKGVHLNDPFRCRICDETFIYYKSRSKHEKKNMVLKQAKNCCHLSTIVMCVENGVVTTKQSSPGMLMHTRVLNDMLVVCA